MTFYQREITRIMGSVYPNQPQLDRIISMRRYINEHYAEDLSLDLLSDNLFLSKFHLQRLFKRYYGQTPRQYLIERRLAAAKTLLANGTTVTDTCFAVGFECPSSFCTLFRQRNGQTPGEFKKSNFRKSAQPAVADF